MNNKFVYTPGPTYVRENVRLERAKITTNPDIDVEFVEFYKNTCKKIGDIINTKNEVYILNGEGILGVEAACASLTERGDRVLVIDNGIYGGGYADFLDIYGGEAVVYKSDYNKSVNVQDLRRFLEKDHNFKYAAIVHCDTPTGVLNDVSKICPLLKEYGIMTVVDAVSSMVGEELKVDEWGIDICIGGSQKAFSVPSGLTIISISEEAQKSIESRKTRVASFYCNLDIWKNYYEDKWFPYTMPISDIMAFDKGVNNILQEGKEEVLLRHRKIGEAVRKAIDEYGLKLFLEDGYSNTVTVVEIPENIGALKLKKYLLDEYNALFSTSLGEYEDKVLRIGHMGENARTDKVVYALNIINKSLKDLGFETSKDLVELFYKNYK